MGHVKHPLDVLFATRVVYKEKVTHGGLKNILKGRTNLPIGIDQVAVGTETSA